MNATETTRYELPQEGTSLLGYIVRRMKSIWWIRRDLRLTATPRPTTAAGSGQPTPGRALQAYKQARFISKGQS